jgi:hypothetical protein
MEPVGAMGAMEAIAPPLLPAVGDDPTFTDVPDIELPGSVAPGAVVAGTGVGVYDGLGGSAFATPGTNVAVTTTASASNDVNVVD